MCGCGKGNKDASKLDKPFNAEEEYQSRVHQQQDTYSVGQPTDDGCQTVLLDGRQRFVEL